MFLKLNKEFPSFRDKTGNYVEVLGIVGNKLVLTYADNNVEIVEYENTSALKVGQRLYFDASDTYDPSIKEKISPPVVASSNSQSPLSLPKDKNSRY